MMPKSNEPGLVLNGLDGGNPLGFLAAIGTLRVAALADSVRDWRMRWMSREGVWRPALSANGPVSREDLVLRHR